MIEKDPNRALQRLAVDLPAKNARVDVELPEPVITDEQLTERFRSAGCVKVSALRVRELAEIGLKVKGIGVIQVQRGAVMLDQVKCDEVLDALRQAAAKLVESKKEKKSMVSDLTKLAQSFAFLMQRKTEVQRFALEIERAATPAGTPVEDKDSPMPNFVPGQKIVPQGGTLVVGNNVHLHTESGPRGG